jgi:pimeloyl-ACP methyl ester carboxylesterase
MDEKGEEMSKLPPPPGQLCDVGGYRMHIQCQGSGDPAAILDSGLLGNSLLWVNTLPAISQHTRACAFDRPGYAWSDPAPADVPRTSQNIISELRTTLLQANIRPPYILLGHSFGAINMLVYAYTCPQEVAGLVLVDPSHPEMFERVPNVPSGKTAARSFQLISFLGNLGLLRWLGPLLARQLLPDGAQTLPLDAWKALLVVASQRKDYQTAAREANLGIENFASARGGPGSLGDLPLEVLSADWWTTGKPTPMKQAMKPMREEQAKLSSRGRHRIVSGCDHANLPVVRPDAVADSVKHILEAVRI